ncbi:hypothetical protein WME79_17130 [Sorangium sp. So ce726]|uniref:hypothetical protein n=1 Tax=Sorangium sp. So ce726 TaxID=3133319 RepID=UPI003F5E418E
MDSARTRPLFTSGKLLRAEDLALEQGYQRAGYRLADRSLHTYGIASGLDLERSGQGRITVTAGFAFDAAGDQIDLGAPVEVDLRASPDAVVWITIRYGEAPAEAAGGARGTFYRRAIVAPEIAVRSSGRSPDIAAGMELLLGRIELSVFRDVVSIDPRERRSSGVVVGALTFLNPTPLAATIAAASDPGALEIRAPQTDILGSVVVAGAVGAGVASPAAALDVTGVAEIPGHGTVRFGPASAAEGSAFAAAPSTSSGDHMVYGDGTYFSQELSPGDAILAGGASAIVQKVLGPNLVVATLAPRSSPPPATPTPFSIRRGRLLARFRRGDGQAVLAVTTDGRVGVGTEAPLATLHVAKGDVGLGPGCNIAFADSGTISSHDDSRAIALASGSLSIVEPGDIALVTGASAADSPPTLVVAGARGHVGVGTTEPADALTANGVIQATGGFMFEGGTVQKTGVVPIPIGTIVDWWQPGDSAALCPEGFQICDGSTVDDPSSPIKGTKLPDLSDRFVRAVVSYEEIGSTGGAEQHTHAIALSTHSHPMDHQHSITVAFSPTPNTNGTTLGGSSLSMASHLHSFPPGTYCAPPTSQTAPYTGQASAPTGPGSAVPRSMLLLKIMRIR